MVSIMGYSTKIRISLVKYDSIMLKIKKETRINYITGIA